MLNIENFEEIGEMVMDSLIDGNKLFVKGGISVISALAWTGKTTYMMKIQNQLDEAGYNTMYINADFAPIDSLTYEPFNIDRITELTDSANDIDVIIIDSLKAFSSYNGMDTMDNNNMM